MILNILKYPDPILGISCEPVREITPEIKQLANDMKETMYAAKGVGLSANQVGKLYAIIVIDISKKQNKPMVMINPTITNCVEPIVKGIEGCLSLPGVQKMVPRFKRIEVQYQDLATFSIRNQRFNDITARCIQHECSHLLGRLINTYPDATKEELENEL